MRTVSDQMEFIDPYNDTAALKDLWMKLSEAVYADSLSTLNEVINCNHESLSNELLRYLLSKYTKSATGLTIIELAAIDGLFKLLYRICDRFFDRFSVEEQIHFSEAISSVGVPAEAQDEWYSRLLLLIQHRGKPFDRGTLEDFDVESVATGACLLKAAATLKFSEYKSLAMNPVVQALFRLNPSASMSDVRKLQTASGVSTAKLL